MWVWRRVSISPEEKQSRLKELSNPNNILSDQEYEEKERLEEELNLTHAEETNINLGKGHTIIPKKKKRTLFEVLYQKLKKKPVTYEELERLRNERTKAYLKRDIAVANYHRKNPGGKSSTKKSGSTIPKLFPEDKEIKSRPQDLIKMSGDNDPKKYKGLI